MVKNQHKKYAQTANSDSMYNLIRYSTSFIRIGIDRIVRTSLYVHYFVNIISKIIFGWKRRFNHLHRDSWVLKALHDLNIFVLTVKDARSFKVSRKPPSFKSFTRLEITNRIWYLLIAANPVEEETPWLNRWNLIR